MNKLLASLIAFLALCATTFSLSSPVSPGAKIEFTQKLVDFVRLTGLTFLEEKLSTITLPKLEVDVAKIAFATENLHCYDLVVDSSEATINKDDGFRIDVNNLKVACEGDWSFRGDVWPHISGSGHFSAAIDKSNAAVALAIGEKDSKMTVATTQCQGNFNLASLHFSGGVLAWIVDLFSPLLKYFLTHELSSKVCDGLKQGIDVELNKVLYDFPTTLPIPVFDNAAELDFSFFSAPSFVSNSFEGILKAEVLVHATHAEPPFDPSPIPDYKDEAQMINFAVSSYTLESAAWVYQSLGLLKGTVTTEEVPKQSPVKLTTKDFKYNVPELYQKYPDRNMSLSIDVTDRPVVGMSKSDNFNFTMPANIVFAVKNDDGTYTDVISVSTTLGAALSVSVDVNATSGAQAIKPHLESILADAEVTSTSVGELDKVNEGIRSFFGNLCGPFVVKTINDLAFKDGFELPAIQGLEFDKTSLVFDEHTLVLHTDVKYTPVKAAMLRLAAIRAQQPKELQWSVCNVRSSLVVEKPFLSHLSAGRFVNLHLPGTLQKAVIGGTLSVRLVQVGTDDVFADVQVNLPQLGNEGDLSSVVAPLFWSPSYPSSTYEVQVHAVDQDGETVTCGNYSFQV